MIPVQGSKLTGAREPLRPDFANGPLLQKSGPEGPPTFSITGASFALYLGFRVFARAHRLGKVGAQRAHANKIEFRALPVETYEVSEVFSARF